LRALLHILLLRIAPPLCRELRSGLPLALTAILILVLHSAPAGACTVLSVNSISSPTVNLGLYNSTAPGVQTATITIVLNKISNGKCTASLAFLSATNPAQMSGPGPQTLQYQVLDSGGSDVLYTFVPGNRITLSGSANNQSTISFTVTIQVGAIAGQSGMPSGTYSDSTVVPKVFDGVTNIPLGGASGVLNVSATAVSSCTIGGLSNPAADFATVPVSAGGVVNTAPINKSYASVVCSAQSTLQVSSLTGGLKRAGTAPGGFSDIIDYQISATFAGASSTLNTATIPTASGTESGSSGTTSSTTPSGTLSVTITPQTPALPLVAGSYADTVRITITPQ
jgi:hypothetical protein